MKKLIAVIVLAALVAGAFGWGRPAWRARKERQFTALARAELARGEQRRALLSARQVLSINSNSVPACEVMAALADLSRAPHAIVWRKRIVELDPTLEHRIMLASCALRYEHPPFPITAQTLQDVGAAGKDSALFHIVSAQLALKASKPDQAAQHFEESIRLEPTNQLHKLNLAVVRLQSRDTTKAAAARAQLAALQASPELGDYALRSLALHHLSRREAGRAHDFSALLLRHPRANFDDRLQHMTILHDARRPEFEKYSEELRAFAKTNAVLTFELAARLLALNQAAPALAWLKSLPQSIQNEQPVPLATANAFASLKEWRALEEYLTAQKWKEQEFVRLALLAFAVRNQNDANVSRIHWDNAVRAGSDRPESLALLTQMGAGWRWNVETEALLWQVVKSFPNERWPLDTLLNAYTRDRNSRGLHSVFTTLLERQGTNGTLQNNLASLSLLLNTNTSKAHQLAEGVYRLDPRNASYASTYAWSLHTQGRTQQALGIIEKLSREQLSDPSIAPYYAALLSNSGQNEKAQIFAAASEQAALLPEERALAASARRKQ